jgi:hypothetical protein
MDASDNYEIICGWREAKFRNALSAGFAVPGLPLIRTGAEATGTPKNVKIATYTRTLDDFVGE